MKPTNICHHTVHYTTFRIPIEHTLPISISISISISSSSREIKYEGDCPRSRRFVGKTRQRCEDVLNSSRSCSLRPSGQRSYSESTLPSDIQTLIHRFLHPPQSVPLLPFDQAGQCGNQVSQNRVKHEYGEIGVGYVMG